MVSLDISSDDASIVLSHDHIFELDYPTTKSNPKFPSKSNLINCRSLNIRINEFVQFTIEMKLVSLVSFMYCIDI